jgi:hypothetical protein
MAGAQLSFLSPSPSYELGNCTGEASNSNFFDTGMYPSPFAVNDRPMEPGAFTDTFNWVGIGVVQEDFVEQEQC